MMKTSQLISLFLLIHFHTVAQKPNTDQVICVINEYPIIIEANPGIINFQQNGDWRILPGKIKITGMQRKAALAFDHLIQIAKPIPLSPSQAIKFRIKTAKADDQVWKQIDGQNSTTLLDTLLTQEPWQLEIKIGTDKINTYRFIPDTIKPQIEGFRIKKSWDSSDQKHTADQMALKKSVPKEYSAVKNKEIKIEPGSSLEIKLKSFVLLPDSIFEYRLISDKLTGAWKRTGNILSIADLKANNQYTLEIKYRNQQQVQQYSVWVLPFWHQKTWIRILALLLVVGTIFLWTRWWTHRKIRILNEQRQRLEEQLTTIQSQLNPHFIFNALSSIEGLVSQGQNQLANEYLNTFSHIMRDTLRNSNKHWISLAEEWLLLEKYLVIEKLRFGFTYELTMQDQIQANQIEVPPMLIQPLLENAIKHGAAGQHKNAWIQITASRQQADMIITVSNNIPQVNKKLVETAGGYGWTFTKQRLEHFEKLHPDNPIRFSFDKNETWAKATLVYSQWFT